jgi:hypothetical protein
MKYIIFDNGGVPSLVIFDSLRDHSDMARRVGLPVLSAGSISFELGACFPRSVTLGISRGKTQATKDEETIRKLQEYV